MSNTAPLSVRRQQLHARRSALVSANAREPRTVSAATRVAGTVTVSASCEFSGVADAITRCRVPRTCQDCLATPGCGLPDTGYCRNVTSEADWFTRSPDYRTANFSAGSLVSDTSSFIFLADSASYCAASDPVCTKCREQFQAAAANKTSGVYLGSQFCKGADGCVCIAMCEVPSLAARVIDWECGQPYINANPLPAISRSSKTTVRGDPRAPAVKRSRPPKETESCSYTKEVDLRGCQRPRSCQSCLDQPACEIWAGRCYDAMPGSWYTDFRNTTLNTTNMTNAYGYGFLSSSTTYCPASDTTCAACRQQFRNRDVGDWNTLVNSYNNFCVGQDDCVCIEVCESELWATEVPYAQCSRVGEVTAYPNPAGFFVVAAIAWFLLWGGYKYANGRHRRRSQRQQRDDRQRQHNMWRNMLAHLLLKTPTTRHQVPQTLMRRIQSGNKEDARVRVSGSDSSRVDHGEENDEYW